MPLSDRANPFVFVVGCPRSGTTLLGRIVDAHRDVAMIHEGRFVVGFFEHRRGLTPEGMVTNGLVDALLAFPPFTGVDVSREQLERLAGSADAMAYSTFVSRLFDLHGAARGKRLVGDKTPHYVRSVGTLHELWPEAKIVHLIRDGRDVCLSALRWRKVTVRGGSVARFSGWNEDPITTVALWWEWLVRLGQESGAVIGRDLYHEIRYESLVRDPAEECRSLCDFLGVPYDEHMLGFHEGRTKDDPALDAKKAWRPVTAGLRDWRSQMSSDDVERFEAAAGGLLDELGYPRHVPHPLPEAAARASQARRSFIRDVQKRARPLPERWQRLDAPTRLD